MSFSRDVRHEIVRVEPVSGCCDRAELAVLLSLSGEIRDREEGGECCLKVDATYMARKLFKSSKKFGLQPEIRFKPEGGRRRLAQLIAEADQPQLQALRSLQAGNPGFARLFRRHCCQKTLLRTVFLCKGSVNYPGNSYHLEMILSSGELAAAVQQASRQNGLDVKTARRRGQYQLYIKDGDTISDFLRFIGAHRAVLAFENVRIMKSVKNQVNRQVNCETANLSKVVQAATRQIDLLERLAEAVDIGRIPAEYQELVTLRLRERECSLQELGLLMNPALSKSGVAYRMRKVEAYARQVLSES